MPRRTLHHRESSGVAWGGWSMDLRQGRSATHLRWSSAALRSSELPVWSRLRTIWRFPDQGGSETVCEMVRKRDQTGQFRRTKGGERPAQVICRPFEPILAEIHQPTTPRDPRTLAMVQCATRHFEQKPAEEGGQPVAFPTQFFIEVQIGSNRWDFCTFVQIDAIQIVSGVSLSFVVYLSSVV